MAPTKPLVSQQIKACFNIMSFKREDIAELTGSVNAEKRAVVYSNFVPPYAQGCDLS